MRVELVCVHKLGRTPEAELALDYAARATAAGRALAIAPVSIVEVEARKPGREAEAAGVIPHLTDAYVIACDEHGRALPSRAFAERLGRLRDDGVRRVVFIIGGADGLAPSVLDAAHERLAFGPQTWPHALARVMLAEQVYRAVTILAGSPYHRD